MSFLKKNIFWSKCRESIYACEWKFWKIRLVKNCLIISSFVNLREISHANLISWSIQFSIENFDTRHRFQKFRAREISKNSVRKKLFRAKHNFFYRYANIYNFWCSSITFFNLNLNFSALQRHLVVENFRLKNKTWQ